MVVGKRYRAAIGLVSTMAVMVIAMGGCASIDDQQVGWPAVDTIALEAPESPEVMDEEDPARIVRGEDGLLYMVGHQAVERGQWVLGRYDGEWPLREDSRPALFAGTVIDEVSDGVARIHRIYQFPDVEVEGLIAEVADELGDETMGKGLPVVEGVTTSDEEASRLALSVGSSEGVQPGDIYGVLGAFDHTSAAVDGQLTRRLAGLCVVVEADQEGSQCRLRHSHLEGDDRPEVVSGKRALFMEPTFAEEPREATVYVALSGDEDSDALVVEALEDYFEHYPGSKVRIERVDPSRDRWPLDKEEGDTIVEQFGEVDAEKSDFHRWSRRIKTDEPALLVGLTMSDEGELVINYTGLGAAIGPGMVAAPPDGGVAMGSPGDQEEDELRGLAAMLFGATLVYRGQTAEGLVHLHESLADPGLRGAWRWHARDQYAMRWGAIDHFDEAMWLVQEDKAMAQMSNDSKAYRNALGTQVRLHDYLDQSQRAYETATEYLELVQERVTGVGGEGSGGLSPYLSARAMHAEMAAEAGHHEEAKESYRALLEVCADGCQGDLVPLMAGLYWASTGHDPELQDEIVERMVDLGQSDDMSSLATARMFQGWNSMRDNELEWAMVAFREARRLYEQERSDYGKARAEFYLAWVQISREESQEAFDRATEALEYMTQVGDYQTMARIYERLAQIYADIDMTQHPEPYVGAATQVLGAGLQAQLARGDLARAAEAGFAYGSFLFRVRSLDEARAALQRAVTHGIRVARLDMVALSHVFLAVIARSEGDRATFEAEIERARVIAEGVDDPMIDELIESVITPPEERPEEDPTQLM